MAKHSAKYEIVKGFYERGLWSASRVKDAVAKKWITEKECAEILGA